ncbi:MAG: hypothetical protein D6743_07280, partial [Calditrichaeota bacterium]
MFNHRNIICTILLLAAFQAASAQDVVVDQVTRRFAPEALYELYQDDALWNNPQLRARTLLNTDLGKLEKVADEIGHPPKTEKTTLYVRADGQAFRADTESQEEGKVTLVIRKDQQMFYTIVWGQNKVVKMSFADLKKMQKKAMQAVEQMRQNMPDIQKMLENLPEAQREKALEAMRAAGQLPGGQDAQKAPASLHDTGEQKDIGPFPRCRKFSLENGSTHAVVWGYGGAPRVS